MYVITGSSSGLGHAVSLKLKELNLDFITVDRYGNPDYLIDLSNIDNINNFVQELKNNFNNIDGVVTCAGVFSNLEKIIKTNYFGTVNLVSKIYEEFNEVNALLIGSVLSKTYELDFDLIDNLLKSKDYNNSFNYNISDTKCYASCKKALDGWAELFLKNKNTARINIVHPSLIKTEMTESFLNSHILESIFGKATMRDYLDIEELADIIVYMLTKAKSINGQKIFVDKGIYNV